MPVAHRPDLEGDQADQQRAEGDEGRQPFVGAGDEEGRDDEGIGGEEKATKDRPDCRPASQLRSSIGSASMAGRLDSSPITQHPIERFAQPCFGLIGQKDGLGPHRLLPLRVFPLEAGG
jgi:hypothetical protein